MMVVVLLDEETSGERRFMSDMVSGILLLSELGLLLSPRMLNVETSGGGGCVTTALCEFVLWNLFGANSPNFVPCVVAHDLGFE